MSMTSSGLRCDVCDTFILGLTDEDLAYPFTLTTIKNELYACKDCIEIIKKLDGTDNWQELPEGHLKRFYKEQSKKGGDA